MTVTPETPGRAVTRRDAPPDALVRRRWSAVGVLALLVYMAVAVFPGWYMPLQPGLDPSWVYALNALPYLPSGFGPDVAFTYGPLGRYLFVMPVGDNLREAAAGWVLFVAALVGSISWHAVVGRRVAHVAAFVAIFVVALGFGLPHEYWWSLTVAAFLLVPADQPSWPWAAVVASVGAAALMFAKTTMGLAGLSLLLLFAVARLVTRSAPRRMLVVLFVPYVVTLLVLGALLIGSPAAVAEWLADSLEIARGFAVSMSVPGPILPVVVGLVAVGVYLVVTVWAWFRDREGFVLLVSVMGIVYVGFRHGLVRHQGRYVIPAVLGALAVVALPAAVRRARLLAVGGAAAALVVMGGLLTTEPECLCPFRWEYPTLTQGWSNVGRFVSLGEVETALREEAAARLAPDRLPADWVERIRASGPVDVIPWEIAYTAANDLRWRPNPVIQTYHAYTGSLDRDVAEHLASDEAPPHLLVQFADIDGRNPMWASPATWRAVLANYELVDTYAPAPPEAVALMARRSAPLALEGAPMGTAEGRVGRWVDVPEGPPLVFADVRLETDVDGALATLLWRVDPVLVDFRFPGGLLTVRMLPEPVENGALASHLPFNFSQFEAFLQGRLPPRVTAFRIHGPGAGSFDETFTVGWRGSDWVERIPRTSDAPG